MSDSSKKRDVERSNPLEGSPFFATPVAPPALPSLPATSAPQPAPAPSSPPPLQRPDPPSQRVRTKIPYIERYTKDTVHIDNRLLPYYFELISRGPNKTIVINEIILDACLKAGMDIAPDLLKQPFKK